MLTTRRFAFFFLLFIFLFYFFLFLSFFRVRPNNVTFNNVCKLQTCRLNDYSTTKSQKHVKVFKYFSVFSSLAL